MKKKPTELGKILRKLRIDEGITLDTMSNALGVTKQHVSMIELGQRNLSKKLYKEILKQYELSNEQHNKLLIAMSKHNGVIELDLLNEQVKESLLCYLEITLEGRPVFLT